MIRTAWLLGFSLLWLTSTGRAETYSIKVVPTAVPEELKEPFRELLSDQAVQLLDGKSEMIAEVWLRKPFAVKVDVPKTMNYRVLDETTFLGSIRFVRGVTDYRQHKIKAGVYTLRLGFQPMDGDHMDTAPHTEFGLLIPAELDESPDLLKNSKELHSKSKKATGINHPGVFLLYPNDKPPAAPQLLDKGNRHWILNSKEEVTIGGKKLTLGIGLVLIGSVVE